jgi:excisionase family DNA binding protein
VGIVACNQMYTMSANAGVSKRVLETTAEVARRLNASERTVRRYAEIGVLPAIRIGGLIRFDPVEIDAVLTRSREQRGAEARRGLASRDERA